MPTKTEAIGLFLKHKTHEDLASLYSGEMEVQVNVAQDDGEAIEGEFKGRKWRGYSNGIETWKPMRIPWNAKSEPEYVDSEMKYNLEAHVEAIGMTGWNWKKRVSQWVAFDFDSLINHKVGLAQNVLDEIVEQMHQIEWVTIRKSTSGSGIHLYIQLPDIETANHNEHAALGRALLGKLSAMTASDLKSKVDGCGGNMWVWHRKMRGTPGLQRIKQGRMMEESEIPPNWKDHLKAIRQRKVSDSKVSSSDSFEQLAQQRSHVNLDEGHKKLIAYLEETEAFWWWDADLNMLVSHTYWLKRAHEDLGLEGVFDTMSPANNTREQNVFCFPLKRGAWSVRRYTPGIQEHPTWEQDGHGWTRCYFNMPPSISTAAKTYGAIEDKRGAYVFQEAELGAKTLEMLGVIPDIPAALRNRQMTITLDKKDDRRIKVEIKREPTDMPIPGWSAESKTWYKAFTTRSPAITQETELADFDDFVRHLVTTSGDDYGWSVFADNEWRFEPISHIKPALKAAGYHTSEIDMVIGTAVLRPWKKVNLPLQPEYPGCREWNIGSAQLAFTPSVDVDKLHYPNWSRVLQHCGNGLDDAIKHNAWARANGLKNGADYLKCWIASMLQFPLDPLPYLFFYGEQDCGKSSFHEAISLLLTRGVKRADAALVSQANFNAELEDAIMCVVEETDLQNNKMAYNRIKDWVTGRELLIHKKGSTPYNMPNATHWIQCVPADTWVMTTEGPRQVHECMHQDNQLILNNQCYQSIGFYSTGEQEVFEITTTNGRVVRATAKHPFVVDYDGIRLDIPVADLAIGDQLVLDDSQSTWDGHGTFTEGLILGWLFGDGTIFRRKDGTGELIEKLYLYGDDCQMAGLFTLELGSPNIRADGALTFESPILSKLCAEYCIEDKTITPDMEKASSEFYAGFLQGFFSADSTVNSAHLSVVLDQSDKVRLQTIQRMLLRLGINSHLYPSRTRKIGAISNGVTARADAYMLVIRNQSNLRRFEQHIGYSIQSKQAKLAGITNSWTRKAIEDQFTATIASIESVGVMPVFDCTVPDAEHFVANGFVVHNCANEREACPIFQGDTRITMCWVQSLSPIEKVSKNDLFDSLRKEAPDFLAEVLNLEIPRSNDRLKIPVIATSDKAAASESNMTPLERFLNEYCYPVPGKTIKYGEFYDRFTELTDPTELAGWTQIKVGRSLPPQYPKGRVMTDKAQWHIGNISFNEPDDGEPKLSRLILVGQNLVAAVAREE